MCVYAFMYIYISIITYFVTVAYIISAGIVQGKLNNDSSFILRCLNSQLTSPLLAESIASWNIVRTVSGNFDTSASYEYNIGDGICNKNVTKM